MEVIILNEYKDKIIDMETTFKKADKLANELANVCDGKQRRVILIACRLLLVKVILNMLHELDDENDKKEILLTEIGASINVLTNTIIENGIKINDEEIIKEVRDAIRFARNTPR